MDTLTKPKRLMSNHATEHFSGLISVFTSHPLVFVTINFILIMFAWLPKIFIPLVISDDAVKASQVIAAYTGITCSLATVVFAVIIPHIQKQRVKHKHKKKKNKH